MAQPSNPQHAYPAARKPGHLPRRALTRLLCVLLALQPMLAQAAPTFAQSANLTAPAGRVSLLAKTDTDYIQKKRPEEDLLWWNERDQGQVKETVRPVEIEAGGGLRINAGRGVVIEYHKTGDLRASLGQLAEAPGLKWITSLQADPRVAWRGVAAAFREWDYEQSGLTEAGAALVALATAAATWGVSAKLSAALTKALPSAMQGAAMSTALTAGTRTLFMQAGVALANNQGDIGATLKQLAATDTLRALATAMVTAGLTAHLEQAAALGGELTRTAQYMERGLIRATVRAGVGTALQGGSLDENFIRALQLQAVSTLGELGAREIGQAFREQKIDRFTQLLAHAALGCATGAVAGDCGAGALGGVVGELAAESLKKRLRERLKRELADKKISVKEAEIMARDLRRDGVNLAKLAAGLSAGLAGLDVNTAADAGGTAAENNAFWVPVFIMVAALLETADRVLLAKDAIDITVAVNQCNQGISSACNEAKGLARQAAIDAGIELSVGNLLPGSKAGKELLRWVNKNSDSSTLKELGKVAENADSANRGLDELLPNGRVPTVKKGFGKWFDDLSPQELDTLWADKKIRVQIEKQIRDPGKLHEWCMVCRAPDFKEWGVSMDEIKRFRTKTSDLKWKDPDTGILGGHGGKGSDKFHNELRDIIDNSSSLDDFNRRVQQLRDRWQIDPSIFPDLPGSG